MQKTLKRQLEKMESFNNSIPHLTNMIKNIFPYNYRQLLHRHIMHLCSMLLSWESPIPRPFLA